MKLTATPAGSRRNAFTLLELLVCLAIIGIIAAMLLPAVTRAKNSAINTACLNQLRQLGIATRIYAEDNGGRLPSAELLPAQPFNPAHPLPRICDVLASEVGQAGSTNSSAVFKCPADRLGYFSNDGSSYEWNVDMNGQHIDGTQSLGTDIMHSETWVGGTLTSQSGSTNTVVSNPVTTPLFLDYEAFHPRAAGPGKNVVFMDGHTGPLTAESLDPGL